MKDILLNGFDVLTGEITIPATVNSHCHTFQPPAVSGGLMDWLKETLKFEYAVKKNPTSARKIVEAKFKSYLANGILASIEYTTSSEEAARIVLDVADEMGFFAKVGYVCMDQNVNDLFDVKLETSLDEAVKSTKNLLSDFPDKVVVIDRFPIAVSSDLRRSLAQLARDYGVLYETHVDESEEEALAHAKIYGGKRIIEVLFEDGVFEAGSKVGLAHCIHTTDVEIEKIAKSISRGTEVYVRACPNSNAQLQSHRLKDGSYVPFPLKEWQDSGVIVTFGLDKGSGRGVNIFAEALFERGRLHKEGFVPSYLDLLKMTTQNGWKSLGLEPKHIKVRLSGLKTFFDDVPSDPETLAGLIIESAQDSQNISLV
jgi:cytosine/adenosine deaminase-related metal-dependent hydrolase